MIQGVALTETERATVLASHRDGKSSRKIAGLVNRGQDAALKGIKSGQIRSGQRKRGVECKLPMGSVRLLVRAARTGRYTAFELQQKYAPMVTMRQVLQTLAEEPNLSWEKKSKAPASYSVPRAARLNWARSYLPKGDRFWRSVVFSDENRFTLDGPDGYSAHWKDSSKGGEWRIYCRNSGGGVIVWGVFPLQGNSNWF